MSVFLKNSIFAEKLITHRMGTKHCYGLIGRTLTHSKSAEYFAQKFQSEGIEDCHFDLFPIDLTKDNVETKLPQLIVDNHLLGFSVTIPYKQLILPLLWFASDEVKNIGAVNSVKVDWSSPDEKHGFPFRLKGYNTDAQGFADTLMPLLQPWHTEALILGTGGASLAVDYTLRKLGILTHFVSRDAESYNQSHHDGTQAITYIEAYEKAKNIFLIVNATPVGTFPDMAKTPWMNVRNISPRHLCYDLVYNPEETRFLLESQLSGASIQNGLPMLHRQADISWLIWNSNR